MTQNTSKKDYLDYCTYCGAKLSTEILSILEKGMNPVYCEFCGAEIKKVQYTDIPNSLAQGNDNIPDLAIFNASNPESTLSPIGEIYFDPDFSKTFKDNLIIVIARIIYYNMNKLYDIEDLKNSDIELSESTLNEIADSLEPLAKKRIRINFYGKLKDISIKKFEKLLKNLQLKIQSDQKYHEKFIIYLRWLISIVFKLISERWDARILPRFEKTILKDIQRYGFDAYTKKFYKDNTNEILKVKKERSILENANNNLPPKNWKERFCYLVVEHIKTKIGINNYNFNKYLEYMKEKGIDNEKIFERVISEDTLDEFLRSVGIDDEVDSRYSSSRNKNKGRRILQIIALLLLKCSSYSCIVKNLSVIAVSEKTKQNLSHQTARMSVRNFLNYFEKFYPNIAFNKWLPKSKVKFTFEYVKKLVDSVSLKITGIKGELLEPKNAQEFKVLKEKLKLKQGHIPLKVKCKKCNNEWNTKGWYLGRGDWPCQYCTNYTYNFKTIKKRVSSISIEKTGIEGKLLVPLNENEWYNILNSKNRKKRPSRIKIKVQCMACGNIWSIEARALVRKGQWCSICAWNVLTFEKLKELVERTGLKKTGVEGQLVFPKTEKEFQEIIDNAKKLIESLKIDKNDPNYKNLQPRRLNIKVKCGICDRTFSTNADRLAANKFCSNCASSEYEQIVCWYASKIFGYITKSKLIFSKVQLSEIITKFDKHNYTEDELKAIANLIRKGGGHLDGYEMFYLEGRLINLGIEYQGEYHYKVKKYLKMTIEDLKYRKKLDILTKDLCKQNKITLLIFPYTVDPYMRHPKKIQEFIVNEFEKLTGINISKDDIPQYDHRSPEFGQYRLTYFLK